MLDVTILLLGSDSSGEFMNSLHDILKPSSYSNLRLYLKVAVRPPPDLCDDETARLVRNQRPDVCIIILSPSLMGQAEVLLRLVKSESPATQVVVGMEGGEPDRIVRLFDLGAVDFITPPLRAIDILPRIWRLIAGTAPRPVPAQERQRAQDVKRLIGQNAAFIAVVNKIPLVARCDASVMIMGETGTGKELCARAIHYLSPRAKGPFVPINCGALPTELVENELFGHLRGAFTGATSATPGLIHEADGGTLFLDEVDTLPPQAQVKVLRFLQDKEYRPLGDTKFCPVDVRVISATNANCKAAIASGRLRQDLYYRLNVIPMKLPPLRERREDILILARYFLKKYAAEFGKPARDFSAESVQTLVAHDWPGNVRELEHVVERAVVFSDRPLIELADIIISDGDESPCQQSFKEAKAKLISRFEKTYIQDLLLANQGNVSKAARAAHKNRRAFWRLVRKHDIDVQCIRAERDGMDHAAPG